MRLRVLLIGLGRWGQNHLRTWRELGADLLVCDERPELLAGLPEPSACDYRELLDRVDAVDVVTPAPSHHAIAREALVRGKDVFVEKPIAPRAAEAFELAALADSRGAVLEVGHHFRFEPAARAVRAAVASGRIGQVRYILSHFMGFKRPRPDGGVAISDAIHFCDLISWILGKEPREVTGIVRDYFRRGMDDTAFVTLDYGYEVAHVEAGYFPPERKRDLEIMGSEGAIACDFLAARDKVKVFGHAHREVGEGTWHAVEGEVLVEEVADEEPLRAELRAFAEACATRRPSPIAADGHAGAAAVAVIEAAFRSAASKRTVALDLPRPVAAGVRA